MTIDRHLDWDGCFNARDLGGLHTSDGRTTRWGALVRSDKLDHLTPKGWEALLAYGIRTVIDLRNDAEIASNSGARPAELVTVHVPLDDVEDTALWSYIWANDLDGSPLYYQPFLERKAARCAAVLAAIAQAEPSGVVFHCGIGRDRTGLISLLLLALAGVIPTEIADDYELSGVRLAPAWVARGVEDQGPLIEAILQRKQTSARALLLAIVDSLDVVDYLRAAGLADATIASIHTRLLE